MYTLLQRLLLALACLAPVLASGSGFGGFGGGSGGSSGSSGGFSGPRGSGNSSSNSGALSSVDQKYELGRSIVAQQALRYQGMALCLATDGKFSLLVDAKVPELMALGNRQALAAALHDCAPETKPPLNAVMRSSDLEALVHFLDQRLSLKLAF
ncbi:MAG: hypothetical protein ACKVIH_00765 [Burkholderiales bacterium]